MNNKPCALNLGMQNFRHLVQRKHLQIWGCMGVLKCASSRKTGHISETVTDTAKVTINH